MLIILDRDGVINVDSDDYVKSPEEWVPIPGSLEAIAALKQAGFIVTVATNQSGIARGLYDLDALKAMHQKMQHLLAQHGAQIDHIAYCPHGPEDNCSCRKPKPGMYEDIALRFGLPLNDVPVVGDSLRDLEAAWAVNASPYLVRTGKGERTLAAGNLPDDLEIFDDLHDFVTQLLS